MNDPKPPSPDEIQKKLTEFMKSNFGNSVSLSAFTQHEEETGGDSEDARTDPGVFDFYYLPRDIKAHLDRFVIQQDEAKKVLSIAVCDHYNNVKFQLAQEPGKAEQTEYTKQNV